jgi:putative endonuclease
MGTNQVLGRRGENHAARFLEEIGMRVLDRNWRCPAGELDIVADDGGWVVAVEVKTRSGLGYGHPAEAVVPAKLRRLFVLGREWCRAHGRPRAVFRVDVVAVLLDRDGRADIQHYRGVGP